MSDQESSSFNVVDRRTGSHDDELPKLADQGLSVEELHGAAADADAAAGAPDAGSETDPELDGQADARSIPDPMFLLSMATMQMDASTLLQALIPIFDSYAWRAMGFIADPKTGEPAKDMAAAQLAIDSVQFLLSKVEAQLQDAERRDLQRRLSDLRMNYITKLREV